MMRYRRGNNLDLGAIGWLIVATIIMFVLTYIATYFGRNFIYLFGLRPVSFWQQPWTILTNLFVHAGIWHIFGNMLTLYFFGSYLVRLVGERNFLLIYFIGGILGNIFFMVLGPSFAVAVGASGAVFAVGGALTVLRPRLPVFIIPIPVPIPLWIAVIGGFLLMSFVPAVAWQAHLGGLALGLIAGYFFRRKARFSF